MEGEASSAYYDVFINHRGPDVKKNIAGLIHRELKNSGLRAFLDEKELQAGHFLSPEITSAIRTASLHIAIFSPRYAESVWCLDELLQMLKSGRMIVPIFWGVQPADLRYIKGPYADAFRKHQHQRGVDIKLVESWKKALEAASYICGEVFDPEKVDLADSLDKIMATVLKEVGRLPLEITKHPVGLDRAAEDFENEVLKKIELREVVTVGIVGLGGSGKSTLVKNLFNIKHSQFTRSCFLSTDVDLLTLQKTLLYDLFRLDNSYLRNTNQGKRLLRDRLKGVPRVLIVVDGIDKEEQIENLLLGEDILGNGSLILVTARDKSLLTTLCQAIYDVKLLNASEARELFSRYAFPKSKLPEDLEELMNEFVKFCGGFPLALKVLGAQLSSNYDRSYWKRQLEKLRKQKLPGDMVEKIVKVSYDSLSDEEKEVFLDVAHFFVGEEKDLALSVFAGLDCDWCLDTLCQKCLVDFDDKIKLRTMKLTGRLWKSSDEHYWKSPGSSKIKMHNLVRDMARQIAREESAVSPSTKPLRILCSQDLQPASPYVRGIRSDERSVLLPFKGEYIHGLRFLVGTMFDVKPKFGDPRSQGKPLEGYFGELVWLRSVSLENIPSSLSLQSLRVLELYGIRDPQELGRKLCDYEPPLQEIQLGFKTGSSFPQQIPHSQMTGHSASTSSSGFKTKTTDSLFPLNSFQKWLGKLTNLVKIVLRDLKGYASLPINFEDCKHLRHLDLSGCSHMEVLPDSFIELIRLQYLALRGCMKLKIGDLGKISKLEHIDFGGCCQLTLLPRGTIEQRSLSYLNLIGTMLEQLPESLEQLQNLEYLLIGSPLLSSLPSSLNNLYRLKQLIILNCLALRDMSESIEMLENMEMLTIHGLENMERIKIAWPKLKVLDVVNCGINEISFERPNRPLDSFQIQAPDDRGAEGVGEGVRDMTIGSAHPNGVSSLTILSVKRTHISKFSIPEAVCPNLEMVDLSDNSLLIEVDGLPRNLIRLNLERCPALKILTCVSNLECLKFLEISDCGGLEMLNVKRLRSLEEIKVGGCGKLHNIEGMDELQNLSQLHFSLANKMPNSIWSDILVFPSQVSTAVLRGVTSQVDGYEMDTNLSSFIENRFPDATLENITFPPMENSSFLVGDVNLDGTLLLCFIMECLSDFKIGGSGHIGRETYIETYRDYRECSGNGFQVYVFLWTQESKMFKNLKSRW